VPIAYIIASQKQAPAYFLRIPRLRNRSDISQHCKSYAF